MTVDRIVTHVLPTAAEYESRLRGTADEAPHSGVRCVRSDAPYRWREIVYSFAKMFRREFDYDFVQYAVCEPPSEDRAFLFIASEGFERAKAVGACVFRYRESLMKNDSFANQDACALAWAWIHPYYRNRGLLSRAWPFFLERFEPFDVEGPLSHAMTAFLRRRDSLVFERELEKSSSAKPRSTTG